MTGREYLHTKLKFWGRLPLLLVPVFIGGTIALIARSVRPEMLGAFVLAIVVGFVVSYSMLRRRFRCPSCRGTLGPLASYNCAPVLRLPGKVKHCPLCGFRFDDEIGMDDAQQANNRVDADGKHCAARSSLCSSPAGHP